MIMESAFLINIFDEFLHTEDDPKKKLMWELKSIINLMQKAKGLDDDFCENGLRMILTLFNEYKVEPWEILVNEEQDEKGLFDDSELVKILFDEIS
jgi:hypothetical protein